MRLNAGQRQYLTLTIVVSILLMAVLPIPGSQTSSSNEHNRFEYPQPAMVSQVIEDDIILVSDWIIVEAGHELIIDNSTIVFIHNEIAIIVQDGGVLSILDSLLYSYPSCSWWISAESGAELVIERSTLEGSGTSTQGGINVRCDNAVIDGCHVSEFGGDGINIGDCNGVRIQNNIVTSCSWEGIGFTQTSDLIISDNQVSDSGYCGIFGANSEDVIIEMNNISATTYSGVCLNHVATSEVTFNNFSEIRSDAICIEYCDNIDVEGNTVFSGYGCGILSVWSTHLLIMNNDIRETVYDGINLIAHSQSISIMNNQFHDIISCGVVSDTSSDILFFGNFMEGVHLHGFSAIGDSDNITVILNTILDCGIGFNFDDVRDVQVIGNWVNESMNHDINVDTCWEGLVYMNAFCSSDIDVGRASTNLFNWDNQTMGNYWMDYDGEDEDQNGIGDSPYEVSDGYQDNYPLTSLDLIHDFRSSCNISAYFWNTVENTNETETEPVAADTQTETLLIFNTSIQMFCVGVLLIILKRRYAT
ncbi:MAG: right-handed parallel beta-helix repeat-containing protein [Candidatus Thorarchaeota archaeon]|nr:right-handed parallel beta-helix repeat-containing protein [Candidatus Thorarchaeota archaeon]